MNKLNMTNHVKVRRKGQEEPKKTTAINPEKAKQTDLKEFEAAVKKDLMKFKKNQEQQRQVNPNTLLREMMAELTAQRG